MTFKYLLTASALTLALASGAQADHGHDDETTHGPTAETCRDMHSDMMARHEAGESHDDIMASLDGEAREMARACHAMMQARMEAEGHAHGEGHGDHHGTDHAEGHAEGLAEGHPENHGEAHGHDDDHAQLHEH
ncbi:hypothetical protein [Maricaulis sp. CAU 1757]